MLDVLRCPCRKKSETVAYVDCCGPFHSGLRAAATAEALMRSRYSAFALGKPDYLAATWHASTRPDHIGIEPERIWLQLRVVEARTEGDRATVEFIARSRLGGAGQALHEVSRFVREAGRWYYVDGKIG